MLNHILPRPHLKVPVFAGTKYNSLVARLFGANIYAWYKLGESAGATADDSGSANYDGSYTGVDLANAAAPGGGMAPYFDGANDYVTLPAGFESNFPGAAAFSVIAWAKINSAALTDGAQHFVVRITDALGNNRLNIVKSATNNRYTLSMIMSGVNKFVNVDTSSTAWQLWAMTISHTADEGKVWLNGVQQGSTQTGLGAWGSVTEAFLGSNHSPLPSSVWSGWIAQVLILNRAATAAELLQLYQIGL
jgi:hypothetical protein